jgi:hypothetical protein
MEKGYSLKVFFSMMLKGYGLEYPNFPSSEKKLE